MNQKGLADYGIIPNPFFFTLVVEHELFQMFLYGAKKLTGHQVHKTMQRLQ